MAEQHNQATDCIQCAIRHRRQLVGDPWPLYQGYPDHSRGGSSYLRKPISWKPLVGSFAFDHIVEADRRPVLQRLTGIWCEPRSVVSKHDPRNIVRDAPVGVEVEPGYEGTLVHNNQCERVDVPVRQGKWNDEGQ
jgi:hypothetical protein